MVMFVNDDKARYRRYKELLEVAKFLVGEAVIRYYDEVICTSIMYRHSNAQRQLWESQKYKKQVCFCKKCINTMTPVTIKDHKHLPSFPKLDKIVKILQDEAENETVDGSYDEIAEYYRDILKNDDEINKFYKFW